MVTYHDRDVLVTAQVQARQTARLADALNRLCDLIEQAEENVEPDQPA